MKGNYFIMETQLTISTVIQIKLVAIKKTVLNSGHKWDLKKK